MQDNETLGHRQRILNGKQKPPTVEINIDGIPDELKELPRWVGWRWVKRKNRWTKPPINARNGRAAKSDDSSTWSTFREALEAYRQEDVDGIGIVNGKLDNGRILVCLDLDDIRDPDTGELTASAQDYISHVNSYSDISPTLTGVKILAFGNKFNSPKEQGCVEFIDSKYATVTGQTVEGTPAKVRRCPKAIQQLYESLSNGQGRKKQSRRTWKRSPRSATRMVEVEDAKDALSKIHPERARDYDDWLHVGMALHSVSDELYVDWVRWSRKSDRWLLKNDDEYRDENPDGKFDEDVCDDKWQSFSDDHDDQYTIASLVHWSQQDDDSTDGDDNIVESTWPNPPADDCFHGPAGEFAQSIRSLSECDPIAVLAQLLVALGNLIGRGPYFRIERDRHFLKLYVVIIGLTGFGRKYTSSISYPD